MTGRIALFKPSNNATKTPKNIDAVAPPIAPSTVLEGDKLGANFFLPMALPTK